MKVNSPTPHHFILFMKHILGRGNNDNRRTFQKVIFIKLKRFLMMVGMKLGLQGEGGCGQRGKIHLDY